MKPFAEKMKAFSNSHADVWTKIETVIPKGLKYRFSTFPPGFPLVITTGV